MNTNTYFIPLLQDINNFSDKEIHVLKQKLTSLGRINNMDKFQLTINDRTEEFEVYTQYTLPQLFEQDYLPDTYRVDGDEEIATEADFVPFVVFEATDTQHNNFEKMMFIPTVEAYRKAQDAYRREN